MNFSKENNRLSTLTLPAGRDGVKHHQINRYYVSKKPTKILIILFLCTAVFSYAQPTPEQIKQAEEAQKKAMEMIQSQPGMRDLMDQIQAAEAQKKIDRNKSHTESEKKRVEQNKKRLEEFYWRNKVASNTNGKFSNWQWGTVEIGYYNLDSRRNSRVKKYIIVGRISSDGLVTINFPGETKPKYRIHEALIPQMSYLTNSDVTFSEPNTPYLWIGYHLQVIKNDEPIGYLSMGNSERATHNLGAPCCDSYGEEGYLLYWVYVKNTCTAKATKEYNQVTITSGESEKIVDQSIVYDLNFKAGWNLIKYENIGHYEVGGLTKFKDKKQTVVSTMPADTRYYFKYDD